MSPLARYYGALALCIAVGTVMFFLADQPPPLSDVRVFMVLFFFLFALFAYNTFGVGCPKCGKRLGLMLNWGGFRAGLPGRYCTRCHADLAVKNSD